MKVFPVPGGLDVIRKQYKFKKLARFQMLNNTLVLTLLVLLKPTLLLGIVIPKN